MILAVFVFLASCSPPAQRTPAELPISAAAKYEEYRSRWEAEKEREGIQDDATRKELEALRQEVETLKKESRPGGAQEAANYLAYLRSLKGTGTAKPAPSLADRLKDRQIPVAAPDAKDIDAAVSKIMEGEHGKLPPAQQLRADASGVAAIQIKNRTEHTLTVFYSGKTSQKAVVAPNGNAAVSVAAGTYSVAASVDAPEVIPFAGTDTLSGGTYSNEFYIVKRFR